MPLNRTDVIKEIAKAKGLKKDDVKAVLDGLEDAVTSELQRPGGQVSLTGFLGFTRKEVAARTGNNPKTGVKKDYPATARVGVKVGLPLKRAVKASV